MIGPEVLRWAHIDQPVQVLSTIGLGFLLLLSGLEIYVRHLRGALLSVTALAFVVSFSIAFGIGSVLTATGLVQSPLLMAVIMSATSLGIILPVLQDNNEMDSRLGGTVIAGASMAEAVSVILLSVLFSTGHSSLGARLTLLVAFMLAVTAVAALIFGIGRVHLLSDALHALQETTAEIRVRGVFIPYFFITTGMSLDVRALVHSSAAITRIPLVLLALLLARAVPALLYRRLGLARNQVAAAGLLQATSLSLPAVAGTIGVDLNLITPETHVALIAAGLISVLAFPLLAMQLNRGSHSPRTAIAT